MSFWQAMELITQKTTLEPLVNPDEPYPRFVLGVAGGSFWEEPHVVSGPVVLFVNDLQRSNVVELGKKKADQYDRRLTVNLTAFVEPGLVVLSASQQVKLKEAVDANGRSLKAVVPGGSSTPILKPEEIDVAMDFDTLMKAGSMLGSGGVVVLDDTACIVKFALRTMKFYQHESCGWCIPCREGTDWLKKTLIRFHSGGGLMKDIDNMYYLSENMLGRTFCPLGDAAAMPMMAFIKKFRQEFEDHLEGRPCACEGAAVEQLPVMAD